MLGQKVTAISRAGIYVPGGKASYPSTVLMNAIPARVAGVDKIYMVTPPGGKRGVDPYVLAAASIAKVDAVFRGRRGAGRCRSRLRHEEHSQGR